MSDIIDNAKQLLDGVTSGKWRAADSDIIAEDSNRFIATVSEYSGLDEPSEEYANVLFDSIAAFANYAFNKSHAAAYALISYRTAYLKAHYAKEYFAAMLTSVLGNQPKTAEYIAECHRHGIEVLPVSTS